MQHPPSSYRITGTVRDSFQRPLAGATVTAFDRDIRSEQPLGQHETAEDGTYVITYDHQAFARGDKGSADLVIRVRSNKVGQPDKTTDTLFNAPKEVTIDINLGSVPYQGPSELETLEKAIHPYVQHIPIDQLTENDKTKDISFLVSKTGQSTSSLILLIMAAHFQNWTKLDKAVFYGLFRQQIPPALTSTAAGTDPQGIDALAVSTYTALWSVNVDTMMTALTQSANTNIIPYALTENFTNIKATLQQLSLAPTAVPGETTSLPPVYTYLGLAGLTQQQQQSFLQAYNTTGNQPALWVQLAQDPAFKGTTALDKTQAIFQLSSITAGNTALVSNIVKQYNITGVAALNNLAAIDEPTWEQLIKTAGSQADAATITQQATAITAAIEQLLPTPVFAARLAADKNSAIPQATKTLLQTFFTANPGFDFTNTHINPYLQNAKGVPPATADRNTLADQIMKIQRVYKIAPTYTAVNTLLKDNLHSSLQIHRMGQSRFTTTYGPALGTGAAAAIYNKAAQQHDSAVRIAATLHSMVKTPAVRVLPDFNQGNAWQKSAPVQAYPNLENLFGIADYCECCDCHSFVSADAYVTDLLEWLGQRLTNNVSARETLFKRRSDIGNIDLNCANAEVQLPYIDLVLELLEDYIIAPIAALTDPTLIPLLTQGPIQAALLNALLQLATGPKNPICNITLLTANATVSAVFQTEETPYDQWMIRDQYITLRVIALYEQQGNVDTGFTSKFIANLVQEVHDTHLTAQEISVNPEYTNTNVYDCLPNPWNTDNVNSWVLYPNRIPFDLPFDLYFTEANVYLVKLGIQRYELIRTFRPQPPAPPAPDPTWYPVACAYLGISAGTAFSNDRVIFTANTVLAAQTKYWGAAVFGQWQTPEVDLFLTACNLSFSQLQQLLNLSFLNPTNDPANPASAVVYAGTDCDTSEMHLSNMTLIKYDAFNRFIRLLNLLQVIASDLTMQLLNAHIVSSGVGQGLMDAAGFPPRFYHMLQLSKQLKLSGWSVLAFYDPIDTTGNNSLYKQLFQNRAISNPLVANLDLKTVTANAALANPPAIADANANPGVLPVVLTACQLDSNDLDFLFTTYPACTGLTLANLSFLYRSGILADALSISVEDLYTFINLTGIYPFTIAFPGVNHPATATDTASFVEKFQAVKKAGFAVDDLNYVLAHVSDASPSLVADNATIATALTTLRSALQAAATAATPQPDPQGILLTKWLADPLLNWAPAIASRLIAILTTTDDDNYQAMLQENWLLINLLHLSYEATTNAAYLALLPPLVFPSVNDIASISYDATPGYLSLDYIGKMNCAAYLALRAQSDDPVYQNAVDQLFYTSQTPQPGNVAFVKIPNPNIAFNQIDLTVLGYNAGTLSYNKKMSPQTQTALLALSDDAAYQTAVNTLYTQSQGQTNNAFVVALPPVSFPIALSVQISYDSTLKSMSFAGYMDASSESMLLTMSTDAAFQAAVASLFTAAQLTSNAAANCFPASIYADLQALPGTQEADRFAYFLNDLAPVYKQLKLTDTITRQLNQLLPAPLATVAGIMGQLPAIYTDFTADAFENSVQDIYTTTGQTNFPIQVNWLLLLKRLAVTANKFNFAAADTVWLLQQYMNFGSIPFQQLPGTKDALNNIIPPAPFTAWEVLNALAILNKSFKARQVPQPGDNNESVTLSVTSVLTEWIGQPVQTYPADLLTLTAWVKTDLDALIVSLGLTGVSSSGAPRLLVRLSQCFTLVTKLTASVSKCISWTADPVTNVTAQDIRQVLKSTYPDPVQWITAIKPVANALRETRRDALLSYLLSNYNFADEEAVYSNFLIYIEMGACQPTTRIVQAYCSIQLFVQRAFMSLEAPAVLVNADEPTQPNYDTDWQQWSFMQRYEDWRLNRLIFLYPENYINPSILPDPSSLYQDMLNSLTQNQVTNAIASDTYQTYLLGLDSIARLEVKGQWYDEQSNTLHVFARNSGGDPRTWYYRTLPPTGEWTTWQPVNLDIAGDTIVPVVDNGRIYLFWPIFTQKSATTLSPNTSSSSKIPPSNYYQIQMASSEYQNGTWSPKKVSSQKEDESVLFPAPSLFFIDEATPPNGKKYRDFTIKLPDPDEFTFVAIDLQLLQASVPLNSKNVALQVLAAQDLGFSIVCFYGEKLPYYLYGPQGTWELIHLMTTSGNYNPGNLQNIAKQQNNAFLLDPCRQALTAYVLDMPSLDNINWPIFSASAFNKSNLQLLSTNTLGIGSNASIITDAPITFPVETVEVSLQLDFLAKMTYLEAVVAGQANPPVSLGSFQPFFYMDPSRAYFVVPEIVGSTDFDYPMIKALYAGSTADPTEVLILDAYLNSSPLNAPSFRFYNFYHPVICSLIRTLYAGGIDALFKRNVQLQGDPVFAPESYFIDAVQPGTQVIKGMATTIDPTPLYPKATLDFSAGSGYDCYNWEAMVYGVMLVASQLTQNQQFQDADRWLKYIFNPADTSTYPTPQKYWITKPFFALTSDNTTMNQLITLLDEGTPAPGFISQVISSKNDPYDPIPIAQSRLTPLMKKVVMMMIDNLIAWADYNYQQDTMESINLAIQYYMLALELLGPKPAPIPAPYNVPVLTYNQIEENLDQVIQVLGPGNADGSVNDPLVTVENLLPSATVYAGPPINYQKIPGVLYFCIPANQQLSGYWDTIEQQLYKISHCLNDQGQFAPPSPFPYNGLNGDLDDIDDLGGVIPNYRFSVMVQKATELCNEVKSLGAALLSALEKQDAEALALLRSSNEISALQFMLKIRAQQITEAQDNLDNMNDYQLLVQKKIDYYDGLLSTGLNAWEASALLMNGISTALNIGIQSGHYLSGILKLIPDFVFGIAGIASTPTSTVKTGGSAFGSAAEETNQALSTLAGQLDKMAAISSTLGSYTRRSQEWQFQSDLASQELEQAKDQVAAATTRLAIANLENQNQGLLISNAQSVDDFLRYQKYTNQQLYAWMVTQLSNIYFQSYQLAYQTAKVAERCFQYELGIMNSSYISFGYWDTLRKGLLAGDQLMYAIKRMESDYMTLNTREKEVPGIFSMAQFDAAALLTLRTTGACFFNITEEMLDKDYAGQYFRRVKYLSITIPAVTGPYTSINARVTLVKNSMRISNIPGAQYARKVNSSGLPQTDARFVDNVGMVETIAAAHGKNDTGMFELNLRDERYNFFEYAGAISTWYIELPQLRQFDYGSISDVIFNLRYTAREGGPQLQTAAQADIITRLADMLTSSDTPGLMSTFSMRRDFPTEWYQFLHPVNPASGQVLNVNISAERFPFYVQSLIRNGSQVKIANLEFVTASAAAATLQNNASVTVAGSAVLANKNGMAYSPLNSFVVQPNTGPGALVMTLPAANALTIADLWDLQLIVHYFVV